MLDWQIASGAPGAGVTFAPIVPAPTVRITPLDVPFAANSTDDHDKTTYSADSGGLVPIPLAYETTPWRLQYTLADGVPHEVQWSPDKKRGHLTVPVFGRPERQPAPSGSGYTITPTGVTMYSLPRVITTGLWTEGKIGNYVPARDGAKIDYDFVNAVSMSGDKGSPDPTLGDQALLIDYKIDNLSGGTNCRMAVGAATMDPTLTAGAHAVRAPEWSIGSVSVMSDPVSLSFITRLTTGLGKLESTFGASSSTLLFGTAASTSMPALTTLPATSPLGVVFPTPVMVTLLHCPYNVNRFPAVMIPSTLTSAPLIVHVQLVDSRQALGVTLNSGMETVITVAAAGGFTLVFPAPIPTAIKLATPPTAW